MSLREFRGRTAIVTGAVSGKRTRCARHRRIDAPFDAAR
jgi:hypothetical protein